MYTDDDLERAIEQGIFTAAAVSRFRHSIDQRRNAPAVDEEHFRLVASFNDIFVVIACLLLLFSSAWVVQRYDEILATAVVVLLSWGLAEFFVRRRKMALPAILLLATFAGSLFSLTVGWLGGPSESSLMTAAAVTAVAAWGHWLRFRVPITVAAGVLALLAFLAMSLLHYFPSLRDYLSGLLFACGVLVFWVAMYWDSRDRRRLSGRSDVAFWLHLAAAPLIVHPVFADLGVIDGREDLSGIAIIVLMYLALTLVSLAIDRRAFMVSSLAYVLYALTKLFETYGMAGDSFAYVGVLLGFSLLLLSGFWHRARYRLVRSLPSFLQARLPVTEA